MARLKGYEKLDPALRDMIVRLRRERGCTISEIHAKLAELDVEVARSTVGEWVKDIDEVAKELRRQDALAETLVREFGDEREERALRANIQLMSAVLSKLGFLAAGGKLELDPREALFLSDAVNKLASAQKRSWDIAKARETFVSELKGKIEKLEEEVKTGKRPLDLATLRAVLAEGYGV